MKQKREKNHKLNFRLCATHSLCDLASNFFSSILIFFFFYLRNKQNIVMKHKDKT